MKRIVLASILKPVDDTRMYEKFALTLSKTYEMHIIGKASTQQIAKGDIYRLPIVGIKRTRIMAGIRFFKHILRLKPNIIIVHTPELLAYVCLYQLFWKVKIIYDVRENYWANIIYQPHYAIPLKYLLAGLVRVLEWSAKPLINHFILAEKCYRQELPFLSKNITILENKLSGYTPCGMKGNKKLGTAVRFIMMGNLSSVYGIYQALSFFRQWIEAGYKGELLLVGIYATHAISQKIRHLQKRYTNIQVIGGDCLVPHQLLLSHLLRADCALLPYVANKSTTHCIPTKLYECSALAVPMLIQKNPYWESLANIDEAALFIDFEHITIDSVHSILKRKTFYPNGNHTTAFWHREKEKLVRIVDSLVGSSLHNY